MINKRECSLLAAYRVSFSPCVYRAGDACTSLVCMAISGNTCWDFLNGLCTRGGMCVSLVDRTVPTPCAEGLTPVGHQRSAARIDRILLHAAKSLKHPFVDALVVPALAFVCCIRSILCTLQNKLICTLSLSLHNNKLGPKGVQALAEALRTNATLTWLQ